MKKNKERVRVYCGECFFGDTDGNGTFGEHKIVCKFNPPPYRSNMSPDDWCGRSKLKYISPKFEVK
jgi:hypothetical protein